MLYVIFIVQNAEKPNVKIDFSSSIAATYSSFSNDLHDRFIFLIEGSLQQQQLDK